MARWERALGVQSCGRCGGAIQSGEPRYLIEPTLYGVGTKFVRCALCAGEPVPADIPQSVDDAPPLRFAFSPRIRDGKLAALPLEREPGNDD